MLDDSSIAMCSYKSLVAVASRLPEVDGLDDLDSNNIDNACALLERLDPILDSTESMLGERIEVPVRYERDFFSHHMDDVVHLRNLARAFRLAGRVASYKDDFTSVARYGMTILNLANTARRGGLVVDFLIAEAISGVGIDCLRSVRERYESSVCRGLIESLRQYESEREPLSEIERRDARWEKESGYEDEGIELPEDEVIDPDSELSIEDQRALLEAIKDIGTKPVEMQATYVLLDRRSLALSRLLATDTAIRCWKERAGGYPTSFAELPPDLLATISTDPFTDGAFIYRASDQSFSLYSTGPDRIDGGGRFGPWPAVLCGGYDLCLDMFDYWEEC